MKEGQDRLVTETMNDSENLVLIVTEKSENLQSFKYRSKTKYLQIVSIFSTLYFTKLVIVRMHSHKCGTTLLL